MKLEVGMYVRYEYEKNVYIGEIKFISEVMCGLNETLQIDIDNCMEEILKKDILKASNNIIDLIEVGDYVNGYKVRGTSVSTLLLDNFNMIQIEDYQIKSIVTKEQFESMSYRVGSEE